MMKLILEDENLDLDSQVVESINEATGTKKKEYFLSGVFSTAGVKNGNGRTYPRDIWEREVAAYQMKINENHIHTLGEWEHPARADVDPMKAVIKITELKLEGDYVYGKAKVLDNPEGNRLKVLIDEGIKIDISSRGVGSVGKNGIVEEFKLITYDLVSKASNPGSHLTGIVEGQSYMVNESGDIIEYKETETKLKNTEIIVETDTVESESTVVETIEDLNEPKKDIESTINEAQLKSELVNQFKRIFEGRIDWNLISKIESKANALDLEWWSDESGDWDWVIGIDKDSKDLSKFVDYVEEEADKNDIEFLYAKGKGDPDYKKVGLKFY